MSTALSAGSKAIRARSPSSAPPERRDVGSTARTATEHPSERQERTSSESSEDFPAPGGPVTPTTWAGASPPSRPGATSARSAAASDRSAAARLSTRLSAAGAAARSRSRSRAPSSAPGPTPRSGRPREPAALGHELHDVAHDLREVEVLRRVHRGHAGPAQRGDVGLGDDPADHDRDLAGARGLERLHDRGDQLAVGAREDRQAHDVDALLQ